MQHTARLRPDYFAGTIHQIVVVMALSQDQIFVPHRSMKNDTEQSRIQTNHLTVKNSISHCTELPGTFLILWLEM